MSNLEQTDLLTAEENCAREPIQFPGSIQPTGALLSLDHAFNILQASANTTELLGLSPDTMLGKTIQDALGLELGEQIQQELVSSRLANSSTALLRSVVIGESRFDVLAHDNGARIIVEFELSSAEGSLDSVYPDLRSFIEMIQELPEIERITAVAAEEVRALTGFDRVMVYQFDKDWNGTVVAESRNERLPSYLDLRFPAADIPAQARALYRSNRLRLIPDADYVPVPLVPAFDPLTTGPLDLSFSALRSVSPVHLQYMRNMGTPASMSISILVDGELWGLISCHHAEPRRVASHMRTACDFVGQVVAMQIGARSRSMAAAERVVKHRIESRLLARMAAEPDFISGLHVAEEELLSLVNADGVALLLDQRIMLMGKTPPLAQVRSLANWIATERADQEVLWTESLSSLVPQLQIATETASGILAVSMSKLHPSYIIWFRPEVVQTVRWGGDPRKTADAETGRLNPRKSFETWKETVSGQSLSWSATQIDAANSLRQAIVGIVMRKAEEMAAVTDELRRSNKELEAFSYSVSHDLRAPFRHIVGFAELLKETGGIEADARAQRYIDTIIEAAHSAGQLVDDLLGFSQMGRSQLTPVLIDMNKLVEETLRTLHMDTEGRKIEWKVGRLEPISADLTFMRSAWQNLLSNAVKYTRGTDPSTIEIGCDPGENEVTYYVKDDGVGFNMDYVDKLFGVFQRLHRIEDYEGSGIGLANVKRVVERHQGRVWAEGELGKGATFFFALPRNLASEA
ncbi:ATP-binding protein [Devosia sp. RR2S18]|uniref:ATP-binding protein n=1 Tax=Devosia rhizosphaerae TaxID=3049774 RepID=UPI0025401FB4|nr:ATP-binding protein [Devosia sp. RR2S18]WIJ23487.1 GAF domain-containing protein [Devosia sp. RR2S18]